MPRGDTSPQAVTRDGRRHNFPRSTLNAARSAADENRHPCMLQESLRRWLEIW